MEKPKTELLNREIASKIVKELLLYEKKHNGHPWTYDFCLVSLNQVPIKSRETFLKLMVTEGLIAQHPQQEGLYRAVPTSK